MDDESTGGWSFFTNHAHVLFCLAEDSEMRLRDVADKVGITERAVQRIVREMDEAGFLQIERVGRRNHYRIKRTLRLRHPIEHHRKIGELLNFLDRESGGRKP